ncbi:hypothetical protein ACFOKJ_14250 [Vogesella amnigena]|uniref:Uncharacterized protein n=1 Tax=Vogesella amnigena TaxID=1507449 RepID=A0ABV7TX59_9NEIS
MKVLAGSLLLAMATTVCANEVQIDFGYFDSPKDQGEKFVATLPAKLALSGFSLAGKRIDLGGQWRVAQSGYDLEAVRDGALSSRSAATGYMLLEREVADHALELLFVSMSLSSRYQDEILSRSPAYCQRDARYAFQDIQSDTTRRVSCVAIVQSQLPEAVPAAAANKATGLAQFVRDNAIYAPGSEIYEQEMFLSRNSNHFYVYRAKPVLGDGIEPFKREVLQLRDNVQQNFF